MRTVVCLTVLLAACAPSSEDAMPAATFDAVCDEIFEPACASCHEGPSPAGGLVLSSATQRDDLLVAPDNAVARESGWSLVVPFDPEGSFLLRKLDGPGVGEGAAMPSEAEMLAEPWRQLLVEWIANGAQP